MILIGVAWLLILAIALYQSIHGLFSAVIMTVLTTICAVFALGYYEILAGMLYATQPAYADSLSLIIFFVIPLLILRIAFDKLIVTNAAIKGWADRAGGGVLGLYVGVVMVGVLAIAMQMLPYGSSVLGYAPFDSSLQRNNRIYCDEFALGLFKSSSALASGMSFDNTHDNLLLELFCARNTAGKNGRVDTNPNALTIPAAFKPGEDKWKQVVDFDTLPQDPCRVDGKSEVLIVKTSVSNSVRNTGKRDGWYRLPATHYRLVTKSGASLYPLGYITQTEDDQWKLVPAAIENDQGQAQVANLCVTRRHSGEKTQEIFWVYRLPIPKIDETDYENSDEIDPDQAEQAKAKQAEMQAPDYMVFRRNAKKLMPPPTADLLPELKPAPTTKPRS
ncbi:MAG: hypothetical protein GY794_05575 [bacterium]|nr:hypothetical protein [bacterium]